MTTMWKEANISHNCHETSLSRRPNPAAPPPASLSPAACPEFAVPTSLWQSRRGNPRSGAVQSICLDEDDLVAGDWINWMRFQFLIKPEE